MSPSSKPLSVAVLTFEQFNELDSLVALHLFGRLRSQGVEVALAGPSETLTSTHGVVVSGVRPLDWLPEADVVLIGSGYGNPAAVADADMMAQVKLDPERQWIGSQCSGALVLHRLGLTDDAGVCTDVVTARTLEAQGVHVIGRPLSVRGRVASAGGCLSSLYLSAWAITQTLGIEHARTALRTVAPVTEEDDMVARAERVLREAGVEVDAEAGGGLFAS